MNEQKDTTLSLPIKFKLKDVLRYNTSVASKNIVNCIVMAVGVGVLAYFFYKMFTTGERVDVFVANHIVLLLVPILIFVMIPWRVWKITATQMQQPAFAYGVTYTFSPGHIVLDIGEASEEMSWDIFVKVVETKYDFRLYVNAISAQIIPKHNMSKEQLETLREIIRSAAPNRSQLR